jgi:hypothetical protein
MNATVAVTLSAPIAIAAAAEIRIDNTLIVRSAVRYTRLHVEHTRV